MSLYFIIKTMARFIELKEWPRDWKRIVRIENIRHAKEEVWLYEGKEYKKYLLILDPQEDNFYINEEEYKKLTDVILPHNKRTNIKKDG